MSNKKVKKDYSVLIKILCITLAVIFLAFSVYEVIEITKITNESHFLEIVSKLAILIYGLTITAVCVLGFVLKNNTVKIVVTVLVALSILLALVNIITSINYAVTDFKVGDALTIAVNVAMIVAFVLLLIKRTLGKYLLIVPIVTILLHLYNLIIVYPSTDSDTISTYVIWSLFMIAVAALYGVFLFVNKKMYLLLGIGVFSFLCFFRMLLIISANADALTALTSFVQLYADPMFILSIISLLILPKEK